MADNATTVTTDWVFNVDNALNDLRDLKKQIEEIEKKQSKQNDGAKDYNRTLSDGTRIYNTILRSAKAYEEELKRLRAAEKDLAKAQAEFNNSAAYDKAKKDLSAVRDRIREINDGLNIANKKSASLIDIAKGIVTQFGGVLAVVYAIKKGLELTIETASKYQSALKPLENISKSSAEYNRTLAFLSRTANKYGLDLLGLAEGYKRVYAAGQQANLSQTQTERLFKSVTVAGAGLKLSNEGLNLTLKGFSDALSKGTVNAEELKNQIGDQIPGAIGLFAKAIGVTEPKLLKMMEQGEILAAETLPKFAAELEKAYGKNAVDNIDSVTGAGNRLQTAFEEIILTFDKKARISEFFASIKNGIADTLKDINYIINNEGWKEFFGYITGDLATSVKVRTNRVIDAEQDRNREVFRGLDPKKRAEELLKIQERARLQELDLNRKYDQKASAEEIEKSRVKLLNLSSEVGKLQEIDKSRTAEEKQEATKRNKELTAAQKAAAADRERELEKLKKLQREFEQTLTDIQLDAENVRLKQSEDTLGVLRRMAETGGKRQLEVFVETSKEYLEKKLQYDQAVVESEREKFKKVYDIQKGKVVSDGNGKFKTVSFTENLILGGKTKEEADKLLEDEYQRDQALLDTRQYFALKNKTLEIMYNTDLDKIYKDRFDITIEQQEREAARLGEGAEKQEELIKIKYRKLRETYKDNLSELKKLDKEFQFEILDARVGSQNKNIDKSNDKIKKDIESRVLQAGQLESEFERNKQKDLLDNDVKYYQQKLELLKNYTENAAYINSLATGQISEEQKKANEDSLQELQKNLNIALQKQGKFIEVQALSANRYKDLWDVAGDVWKQLTGKVIKFSEDANIDNLTKQAVSNAVSTVKDALKQVLDAELQNTEDRLRILDEAISGRQTLVDQEFEKYQKGLANSYEYEKAILDKTKEERDKELEHKKKVQKQQAVIDSVELAANNFLAIGNMIAAASNVIKDWSKVPFVGVAIGVAAAAALVGTFAGIKSKFKAAQRLRYGGDYNGMLEGNLHGQSENLRVGNTNVYMEGGEYVNRREVAKKHRSFLDALNNDRFRHLTRGEQMKMMSPMGIKFFTEGDNQEAERVLQLDRQIVVHNTGKSQDDSKAVELLGQIRDFTSNIPNEQIHETEDQIIKTSKNKMVIINKKKKP